MYQGYDGRPPDRGDGDDGQQCGQAVAGKKDEAISRSKLTHSANAWSDVGTNFHSSVELFRCKDRFRPKKSIKLFDRNGSKCASDSNIQDAVDMMEPGLRKIRKDSYHTTTPTASSVENCQNQFEPVYSHSKQLEPVYHQANQFGLVYPDKNQFEPLYLRTNMFKPVYADTSHLEPVSHQFESSYPDPNQFEPVYTDASQFEPVYTDANQFEPVYSDANQFEPVYQEVSGDEGHYYGCQEQPESVYEAVLTKVAKEGYFYNCNYRYEPVYQEVSEEETYYDCQDRFEPVYPEENRLEPVYVDERSLEPVYSDGDRLGLVYSERSDEDDALVAGNEDSGSHRRDESGFFSWQTGSRHVTKIPINQSPSDAEDLSDSTGVVTVNGRRFDRDADDVSVTTDDSLTTVRFDVKKRS